jgi:hypothetical protein
VDVNDESRDAVTDVAATVLGETSPTAPVNGPEKRDDVTEVSPASVVAVAPKDTEVEPIVTALLASKLFGTVALFSATTFEPTTYTFRSDG